MIDTISLVCDSPTLVAREAIIIYRASGTMSGRMTALGMVHDIENNGGRPTLKPGIPMSPEDVDRVVRSLYMENQTILPENLLCFGLSRLVWWVPPHRDIIWFNVDKEDSLFPLNKLNGKNVNHPGVVLLLTVNGLRAWAVRGNRRPNEDTMLYQAPYLNVSNYGDVCLGMKVPRSEAIALASIPVMQRAFFETSGTHASCKKMVRGGAVEFWNRMRKPKEKPDRFLVPTSSKLKDIL